MIGAGIDAGSRAIKVVLYDHNKGEILASGVVDQGIEQNALARDLFERLLKEKEIEREKVSRIVATGYGRAGVEFADTTITEITCHARGVLHRVPEARTIIEIGGQDSKLIWLDGQPEQGAWHAPFKISRNGEFLRLSGPPSKGFPVLDSLSFGPQETDLSWGRSFDGGADWMAFGQATAGFSNLRTDSRAPIEESSSLRLWPNPLSGGHLHFNRKVSGWITDLSGRVHLRVDHADRVELPGLAAGVYLFRSEEGEVRSLVLTSAF